MTVRRRTATGLWQTALRLIITRGIGLIGLVYVSRQLGPSQVGLIALAAAVQTVGHITAEAGLGIGLIQRTSSPSRVELSVVFGIQLAVTSFFAALASCIAYATHADIAIAIAIALWSLPAYVARSVPAILADRRLDFRPAAVGDVAESVVYTCLSISAVALGFGAEGVIAGTVVAAAIGSIVVLRLVPDGRVAPRLAVGHIRGILGFSTRVQLTQFLEIARAQLMGIGILAIGGLRVLGFMGIADRLMQFPLLVVTPIGRVAFPAMARAGGEQQLLGDRAGRAARILTGVLGLIAVPLIAALPPGVTAVFGVQWEPATGLVAGQAVAVLIGTPATCLMANLLFAQNNPAAALRVQAIAVACTLLVGLGLLAAVGPVGLGVGLVVAALIELSAYSRVLRRSTGISLVARVAPILVLATAVAGSCFALSALLPTTLAAAAAAAVVATLIYGGSIGLLFPDVVQGVLSWAPPRLRGSRAGQILSRLE